MKAGILGYGEVGKAIAGLCVDPKIKDLVRDDGLRDIDVLHVCIPFSKKFKRIVIHEIKTLNIKELVVIIHSTVPPGTTRSIAETMFRKTSLIVHSPVRGIHPDIEKGLKTFVKFIGAEHRAAGLAAQKVLQEMGMKTHIAIPAISTEIAKAFSTTYYSACIKIHDEMNKICQQNGIDFETMTKWNQTYNDGYSELGCEQYVRPTLYPPSKKGIGGHCCLENAIMLREHTKTNTGFLDWILSLGKIKSSIPERRRILNRTWLYCEYWGKNRTIPKIAKTAKVPEESVVAIMDKLNIPRRDKKWAVSNFAKWFSWIKEEDIGKCQNNSDKL